MRRFIVHVTYPPEIATKDGDLPIAHDTAKQHGGRFQRRAAGEGNSVRIEFDEEVDARAYMHGLLWHFNNYALSHVPRDGYQKAVAGGLQFAISVQRKEKEISQSKGEIRFIPVAHQNGR